MSKSIRIPDELHDALRARASEERRTLGGQVRWCLEVALGLAQERDRLVYEREAARRRASLVRNSARISSRGSSSSILYSLESFEVPETLLENWKQAFPAVNVSQEVQKAHAWAAANPKNAKKNWQRFLVNWLGRAQERAPRADTLPTVAHTRERPALLDEPPHQMTPEETANAERALAMIRDTVRALPRVPV